MSGEIWPDAGAYAIASRDSSSFFVDARIQRGVIRTSPLGIPLPATGRNAVVFHVTLPDESSYAARCFTTPPRDGRLRYEALAAYLERCPVAALADATWIEDAVRVNGRPFPMTWMEWVDGRNLDVYVQDHLDDRDRLRSLVDAWTILIEELDAADVAHGDLQHGNVLVEADGMLRLVDLDGVWTPASTDLVPSELGHRHFQHPQRIAEGYWSGAVDAFAALSIAVSLEAVGQEPSLWGRFNDGGNNLILSEIDYLKPGDTPLWSALSALDEPMPGLLSRLEQACRADVARLDSAVSLLRGDGPVVRKAPPQFLIDALKAGAPSGPPVERERRDDPGAPTEVSDATAVSQLMPWLVVAVLTFVAVVCVVGGIAVLSTVPVP